MPTSPTLLRGLLFSLAAHAAAAAEPAEKTVASIAAGRETRVTAKLAPSSDLHVAAASRIATRIAPLVPGTEIFTVVPTGSMRPAFDHNTVLLTEPAPFGNLRVGDIVVFRHRASGARVVHRILERRDGGYWTKGDHNARMDEELVTRENYLGRVYGILYTSRSGNKAPPEPGRRNEELLADAR
jgi:signal peptidase